MKLRGKAKISGPLARRFNHRLQGIDPDEARRMHTGLIKMYGEITPTAPHINHHASGQPIPTKHLDHHLETASLSVTALPERRGEVISVLGEGLAIGIQISGVFGHGCQVNGCGHETMPILWNKGRNLHHEFDQEYPCLHVVGAKRDTSAYPMTISAPAMCSMLLAAFATQTTPPSATFPANPMTLTREIAREMIDVLSEELKKRHHPQRQFEPARPPRSQSAQPGGRNALTVLALLDSGTPAQESRLAAAIGTMLDHPPPGTYARSARLMALARLPEDRIAPATQDIRHLLDSFDAKACGWDYGPSPRTHMVDQSLTQFATLALSEINDRDISVPEELFRRVRQRFLGTQGPDGGWGYRIGDAPRGSMTAAGLATLSLCNRHATPGPMESNRSTKAINQAIKWLELNYTADANPGSSRWTDYWLLSMQRAGDATGIQTLAGHSWLHEGAASIARRLLARKPDGSWRSRRGTPAGIEKICFALMFMQAATRPMAIGMIRIPGESIDPVGLAPVADAISDMLEQRAGWARLGPEDDWTTWSRCPVLIMEKVPTADDPEGRILLERITRFARHGGTIIFMSGNANPARKKSINAFGETLLPGASWRDMARDDPRRSQPSIRGMKIRTLGTSTREWVINIPLRGPRERARRNPMAAIAAITTIWRGATGGVPWPRLPSQAEEITAEIDTEATHTIVEIQHPGDWNPEPMALQCAARMLSNAERKVTHASVHIDAMNTLPKNALAWIRGHDADEAEALDPTPLLTHLDRGGSIFMESTGAKNGFAMHLAHRLCSARGGIMLGTPNIPEAITMHANERREFIATPRECSRGLLSHGLLDPLRHLSRNKTLQLIEMLLAEHPVANP